jgi:LysM repeat protein
VIIMQRHALLALIGLIVGSILLTACSLTLNFGPFPELTLEPGTTATVTPRATATSTVTVTPVQPTPVNNAPTPVGCVLRTEWPTYTVVRGDTLGQIARRGNTTVAILTQANCLPNANTIFVGQKLYVPTLIPTPVPPTTTPNEVGMVDILPFVQGPSGIAELDRGATVTFIWNEVPTDAASVQFVLLDTVSGGSQVLATDSLPADGASATWVVPDQLNGSIAAYAYRADQSLYRSSFARPVVSRPPLSTLPEILYFRTSIVNGVNTLEWQTRNVPFVNIVWNHTDGAPGGYYESQPGSGSIAVPPLGPDYRPNALFFLFAMDANGNEIPDPNNPGGIVEASLIIPVTTDAIISASPNPVAQGGTVTLTWNVVGSDPNQQYSISRSRATEAGYDLIKEHLPASGELTFTLQPEYQNFVEFILHAHGSSPEADLYSSVLVPVIADDMSQ